MAATTQREIPRDADSAPDGLEHSVVRRRPTNPREVEVVDLDDGAAEERVASFLECVESRRQRSNRVGLAVLGVGALVAGVAYLTSIGVVGPDARAAAASAGTLVVGYFAGQKK